MIDLKPFAFYPIGDSGIKIQLSDDISLHTNKNIHQVCKVLEERKVDGIVEIVPSYHCFYVYYNPLKLKIFHIVDSVEHAFHQLGAQGEEQNEVVLVPTLYGGEYGIDLTRVAQENGVSESDVIQIHSSIDYFIYMMGFLPGFPYLGGVEEAIATPRLTNPRTKVAAGFVGIADRQTGIYPVDSPGGWNIVGRTPLPLFNADSAKPFLFHAGQYIRFTPISEEEFYFIQEQVNNDKYVVKVVKK